MEQYNVTGMTCAACSARVEKAVSAVPGVESCAVSLLTNSMGVAGTASPAAIIAAVENAGYGASLRGAQQQSAAASAAEAEEALRAAALFHRDPHSSRGVSAMFAISRYSTIRSIAAVAPSITLSAVPCSSNSAVTLR